ncbi:hypothetical protein [Arthrobacter sp. ISL-72]|uniref:hypothetical protein n=1 Tax=Arthrobacter sp. ISL-72 TaxID=2819114 RepID=UPI001BE6D430|nr:hypothetical protein [Arthrobacter sp. ISL-72]MBT2596042.1 hypothetical protein [Arthrobacter sp. ISL-72]
MIEILQWSTLAVCCAAAVARIPSALRGENRSLFYIFLLATLAILLSIDGPYVAIDSVLGGTNITNLILRFIVFAVIFFIGLRSMKAFGAHQYRRWLLGWPGMLVFGVISAVMILFFIMMDSSGSSAGLAGVARRSVRDAHLVEYYGAAGRAYPAYVSLVLLPAIAKAVASRLPVLVRVGALLLGIGGASLTVSLLFPFIPPQWSSLKFIINYGAALCFVLGLAVFWTGRVRATRVAARKSSTAQ